MDMKLDLFELLREFPEATLTVHAGDLGHFARELLAEARQDFERERAAIAEGKTEEYLTPEMVKTLLRISESTLYRMAKAKILVPVFVGGQKRYRRSDLDKILSPPIAMMPFTTIYKFMWKDLGLHGAEKEFFAVIYGFWRRSKAPVEIPIRTVTEITGRSRTSVIMAKRGLLKKELVAAQEIRQHEQCRQRT